MRPLLPKGESKEDRRLLKRRAMEEILLAQNSAFLDDITPLPWHSDGSLDYFGDSESSESD